MYDGSLIIDKSRCANLSSSGCSLTQCDLSVGTGQIVFQLV